MTLIHTFAGNPLDRADALRRNADWLDAAIVAETSRYLPLWQLNVLIGADGQLGWLPKAAVTRLGEGAPPVFLGLVDSVAHFAQDISATGDPTHELGLPDGARFEDCRAAAMRLDTASTGIIAQARAQVNWHRRHGFCSVCGARTTQARGGHVRRCGACSAEHFPRTDPVAIMLVIDREQDRCLLGQPAGPIARTGFYSALAGFIDQGESIEEAVRREVQEEAGVIADDVRYHSSQPWPFPSSLMIGCHATARSTDITMDPAEMADVAWFDRDTVRRAMAGEDPKLKLPGPIAIAHHLIQAWVAGEV
ncbi:MAG: NAD(+) diphosphatase [Gammaproteobacteria bacterium]